jgi:cytochrome c2
MNYRLATLVLALAVTANAQAASSNAPGNAAAGRLVYLHQCSGCHSNLPGMDRFGPTLAGVYGRKVGTAPLHHYSAAMHASKIVWNATTLNGFLTNPRAYMPGTIMPYSGLKSPTMRTNLIAYLKSISPQKSP